MRPGLGYIPEAVTFQLIDELLRFDLAPGAVPTNERTRRVVENAQRVAVKVHSTVLDRATEEEQEDEESSRAGQAQRSGGKQTSPEHVEHTEYALPLATYRSLLI